MARWYLVRHGETAWNAENRIQGQTDVPLHDVGRREARQTGERLAGVRFAAAYCSDLSRTQETARIILGAQGEKAPELRPNPALREIAFGDFEGMVWPEIRQTHPRLGRREIDRDLDFAPPGGESFRDVLLRVNAFARSLEREHADDDVLVVGHGAMLRALAVSILRLPPDTLWQLRGLKSGSISIVLSDNGTRSLTAWNDAGHLIAPSS